MKLEERFWSKVDKSDGCWNWKAGCYKHPRLRTPSYGCFSVGHKMIAAHKVSWELSYGEIPAGMKILLNRGNAKKLATKFNVSYGTITDVITRSWKHAV